MFKFLGKLFGKKAPKAKLTKNGKTATKAKTTKAAKPAATATPTTPAATTDATSKQYNKGRKY